MNRAKGFRVFLIFGVLQGMLCFLFTFIAYCLFGHSWTPYPYDDIFFFGIFCFPIFSSLLLIRWTKDLNMGKTLSYLLLALSLSYILAFGLIISWYLIPIKIAGGRGGGFFSIISHSRFHLGFLIAIVISIIVKAIRIKGQK